MFVDHVKISNIVSNVDGNIQLQKNGNTIL